jgi:ribosomal protein S12 methylthiotransferase
MGRPGASLSEVKGRSGVSRAASPAAAGEDRSFFLSTLGCAKNDVDSAKLAGWLVAAGYARAASPEEADLLVVNTCAFIQAAREESIDAILSLAERRRPGASLAVTGCLAERSGAELAAAMPEVDVVAGFGADLLPASAPVPVQVSFRTRQAVPAFDLLELPRPPANAPWAYVKVAEGCDRRCGFCAIPSFRGRQRSRLMTSILREVEVLDVSEVVLVAQDLASYGRDRTGSRPDSRETIEHLVTEVARRVEWVRLLYLYPSSLTDRLIETVISTGVPYFDISLQHVSPPLLRLMRRFGSRARFLDRIRRIRQLEPGAVLRSSFVIGYPGESEADQDELLGFLAEAELDWAGFFAFSREPGTYADAFDEEMYVDPALVSERISECSELQQSLSGARRRELIGRRLTVLQESEDSGRTYREAPEIDGVVRLLSGRARMASPGSFLGARCVASEWPDLVAEAVG